MQQTREKYYKEKMEALPVHKFLGLKVEELGHGSSCVSIPTDSHTLNVVGSLHGGVTYLVSDVAAILALGPAYLEPDEFAVTIDYQCSLYRGTDNGPVIFQAQVTRRTRRLAFMNVKVTDGGGELLAEARVTKAITHPGH